MESDWHANNKWGLLNPDTEIEGLTPDGRAYIEEVTLNPEQEFLWELREQNLDNLVDLADGDDIIYLHTGDVAQGNKHPTTYVTDVETAAQQITYWNALPVLWIENVTTARFIYGTEAHDKMGHSETRSLLNDLRLTFPDTDIAAIWHGLAEIDGLTFDYSHHGPSTGMRNWTEGNQMRYYTKSLMADHIDMGQKPPDYILRGHFHDFHWETVRKWIWKHPTLGRGWLTSHFIIIPSMCGMGSYARKVTHSDFKILNGMLAFEIVDNKLLDIHEWVVGRDLRTRETF